MKLSDCVNFRLTVVQSAVFSYLKQQLNEINLVPIQYAILKCLMEEKDVSPSFLSKCLYLNNSTITSQLTRLEERGLLVREFSTVDRRSIIVRITEAGAALAPQFDRIVERVNQELFRDFQPEETAQFYEYLDRLLAQSISMVGETE